jgi:hypothetical protein
VRLEVIPKETHSLFGTYIKTQFSSYIIYTGQSCSDFCYDNGSQDGRDIPAGLTNQIFYQRLGQIPCIFCMWCLVQSARPSFSFASSVCDLLQVHVGLIFIFPADIGSSYICDHSLYWRKTGQ